MSIKGEGPLRADSSAPVGKQTIARLSFQGITGLLFIMVGLIYDRAHTRQIAELSGLMHRMPMIGTVLVITGFAALGLPGLSGFVAELTTFLGSLQPHPVATTAAIFGVVLSAGYILWTVQRVLHGPPAERWRDLTDATAWWEVTAMASLVLVILAVGLVPTLRGPFGNASSWAPASSVAKRCRPSPCRCWARSSELA